MIWCSAEMQFSAGRMWECFKFKVTVEKKFVKWHMTRFSSCFTPESWTFGSFRELFRDEPSLWDVVWIMLPQNHSHLPPTVCVEPAESWACEKTRPKTKKAGFVKLQCAAEKPLRSALWDTWWITSRNLLLLPNCWTVSPQRPTFIPPGRYTASTVKSRQASSRRQPLITLSTGTLPALC